MQLRTFHLSDVAPKRMGSNRKTRRLHFGHRQVSCRMLC